MKPYLLLLLAACGSDPEDTAAPAETDRGPPETLPIPDVAGVDFPAAFSDGLRQLAVVNTAAPWQGFTSTLGGAEPGCPDLWVGPPATDDADIQDGNGLSWYDTCSNTDGTNWAGFAYWETAISVAGNANSAEGRSTDATRALIGDGTVKDPAGSLRYSFNGEASDSIYEVEADGYTTWTWSSLLTGTVGGTDVFDGTATPGGYRADLYLSATGGVSDRIEARGDLYMFTDLLAGRFDSIAADLTLIGPLGAAPDACTLEPYGWIGLRDPDAFWYDLVFLPAELEDYQDPYANDPLGDCDGCGTLYIRGVDQGQVCVDHVFDFGDANPGGEFSYSRPHQHSGPR